MVEDWKINRDRTRCEKPGCPLPSQKTYTAVLELPSCVRRDLCDACFADYDRKCAFPPVFWRATRRSSGSKEPVLDLVSLRMLFDRLGQTEDEKARSLRYFVALLLIRKRALRMVHPRNAEEERADLVVVDPKLKEMEPVLLFAPPTVLDGLAGVKDELLAAIGSNPEDTDRGVAEPGRGPAST